MILPILYTCLASLLLAFAVSGIRLLKGPTAFDRLVALDGMAICVVGCVGLLCIYTSSALFLDLILVFCLIGFVTTTAFADYINNRMEAEEDYQDTKPRKKK